MEMNKHRLADWPKAPEWAMYHVLDEDFVGRWHKFMPSLESFGWLGVSFFLLNLNQGSQTSKVFPEDLGIDWRETLESRPQ